MCSDRVCRRRCYSICDCIFNTSFGSVVEWLPSLCERVANPCRPFGLPIPWGMQVEIHAKLLSNCRRVSCRDDHILKFGFLHPRKQCVAVVRVGDEACCLCLLNSGLARLVKINKAIDVA